ncbi:MAG: phosphodiesterase [Faecousia sp.]
MKLLIASDIHGSAHFCGKLMERIQEEQPEQILLLGDLLYHGPRNDLPEGYAPKQVIGMLSDLREKILAVRGNCEAEVDQMVLPFSCMADYTLFMPEPGKRIFATHGHLWNPEHLPPLPAGSAFLYGHTHVKSSRMVDGVLTLNPGSVSIPKDGTHSYMTYENGIFHFKSIEGGVLEQVRWEP